MHHTLLVINPGSTSTKVAVFKHKQNILQNTIHHPPKELEPFQHVWEQLSCRQTAIENFLNENHLSPSDFSAIVGRGGLLKSIPGGTYRINPAMLEDARLAIQGEHPANLGCVLAWEIAEKVPVPSYTVDPISVDEFEPLARYSGHPLIQRRCLSHALNIHAVSRLAAEGLNIPFEKSQFIVAHLGGGISICPVKGGRIIDVNDASSDGPFSPERTGGLPLQPFLKLCFSGQYTYEELRKMVMGKGGLIAYLGTNDASIIERQIENNHKKATEVYMAMAYQIAKEIGAMATVLSGKIQTIILSGGLANSTRLTNWIKERIGFIAPVSIYPGEYEMQALAQGALRVLLGQESSLTYT